jgi:uncharacterized protein (TIGR02147 family)
MRTHSALKMYFERRRKSAAGFTLRSLARRLEVSPSFLSRVLNGKRPLPDALRSRLAVALNVESELLVDAVAPPRKKLEKEVGKAVEDWAIAGTEAMPILRAWYYVPILELTTLENCDGSVAQVAQRLGLRPEVADMAMKELAALGMLKLEKGRYRKSEKKLRLTSSRPNPYIRKFHDEMLERAQRELRSATAEEELQRRLITGITVSANPERVQAARRKLADCLHEIANELIAEPGTEVYHLSGQLFPLTKK